MYDSGDNDQATQAPQPAAASEPSGPASEAGDAGLRWSADPTIAAQDLSPWSRPGYSAPYPPQAPQVPQAPPPGYPAPYPPQAPQPGYPAPQPYSAQPPYPAQPPTWQWTGQTAPSQAPASAPAPSGAGRRGVVGWIVAAALLSAVLSGAGTYIAVSVSRSNGGTDSNSGQTANAQTISLTENDAIVRVANLVKPSVVTITTSEAASGLSPFSVPETGAGSGFIVSANGLILTNNHVVAGATSLKVTLDDTRELDATVVATDATHDLAIVSIKATGLTPVNLGDSTKIQVGQLAIAIGSPLGTFTDSVTQGIVSGTDRAITVGDQQSRTTEKLSGLIQTDAAINPGNSGGPLLDASGSAIGIITATASDAQGVGFAIPINQAKQLLASAQK